jgi:protein involved in polysaccharide export with SLBB domain
VTVYAAGKPDQADKRAIGEGRALFAGSAHDNPELSPGDMVVVGSRAINVSVVGRVARPGAYELLSGARIADALAAAGGMASGADAGAVVYSRRGSEPGSVTLDAEALLRDPSLDANALLADGDALFVPEAREQVAIMGEVARPGVYPAGRGTTLMDILAAAGGPTDKADLGRVKVYEGQSAEPAGDRESDPAGLSLAVAHESLVYEGDMRSNPPVMPGQVVVVPSSAIRVQVVGQVQRPGSYELKRGAGIVEAITAAGGVSTAGDGTKVVVTRRGGESDGEGSVGGAKGSSNEARAIEIDVDAILAGGAAGLELADGDTVYVPELSGQVVVLGEVARPGAYRLPRGAKLADAVAAAGGLTARASLENVTIYAGGDASVGTGAAIGQGKALFAGDGAANPTLGATDVVVVGSRMINVTVVGAASRPGVYELAAGARLLDAVAAAGGVSALGDAKHVVLTRGTGGRASGAEPGSGQTAAGIDLDALGRDPGSQGNAVLGDGDVVYIPEAPEKLKRQVAVLGAVARPGVYPADEGTRLMEAIAAAGGPLDASDLGRVKVYRGGEPAEGMDLEVADDRLVYDGDIKANPVVEPSSVIVVPGTEVRVYVAGFVARPGQVVLRRGATALDAIAAAGGVTSSGDGTRATLARKTGEGAFSLEIDVTSVLDARELQGEASGKPSAKAPMAPPPLLEDGDALFVPEAVPGQVLVLGEVARPGSYKLTRGARALDLIAAAGGATPKANLEEISVYREGILSEPQYMSVNVGKRALAEGAMDNPEARAGDVIVVASRMITVNVIGAVARPGTFELQPGASAVDAVAAAGGTRADADAARISVARKPAPDATKSEVLTVDLEAAIRGANAGPSAGGAAADSEPPALLADGDVIFVPEAQGQVLVLGEVARPGAYKLPREARLLDAIAAAGGTTARASLESVTVYKDGALAAGTTEPLGRGKVLFSGKVTENPRINPGDVVTVGSRMMNASVIGRAARPGSYELPVGSRVIDAVAAAGGVALGADRRSVLVIPAGKSGPSATVDLDQALRGGDVGHTISDGDVVFIPDTRQQVAVMGEVARPGVYAYAEGMTLMEVMAMAGGPSAKADLARVRLYRGERVEDALRLEVADDRLAFEGDVKRNPGLAPGDILFVPSGRIRVQVAGHIARTGEVELRRGATILDAISAAGGLAQAGDGARVVVTRRGEGAGRVFEVDVDGLLRGGVPQAEAACLEDGDVVFVPEANRKIAVMGGVARPGLYDYKTGMKFIEGLAMAGGPTAAARLDRVMVYSGDQAVQIALGDAKAKALTIDPTKGNNPELKSGDIIIVPLSEKIDWNMIISILSAINQIKGIITR